MTDDTMKKIEAKAKAAYYSAVTDWAWFSREISFHPKTGFAIGIALGFAGAFVAHLLLAL